MPNFFQMVKFILLISTVILVISCSGGEKCEKCELENQNDTLVKKDTVETLESALMEDKSQSVTKEQQENKAKIEKKYGEQWDFCACVKANDSINKAFIKNPTDKQVEKLMERSEYVDLKCKEFLTQPNTTPEERAIHEKKVKKCLRGR